MPVDRDARRGSRLAPSVDHVVPVAEGGTKHIDNLRLAHIRCNARKGKRLLNLADLMFFPSVMPTPLVG